MADIKARRLAFIACGWFASSWLAIKDETKNTLRKRNADAVKTAKKKGSKIVSIVNVMGSTLTRISDDFLLINAGPEICVLSTKTYTAQLSLLLLLAYSCVGRYDGGKKEIETIRKVCQEGKVRKVKLTKIDVFLQSKTGELFLFDLKSAKPNIGEFKGFKRTLLEWTAAVLGSDPKAKINTIVAIPYNPYEPKPYTRWTMRGMLDLDKELKVAHEFWDFIGGKGAYQDLLDCFEKVGIELRPEIDKYFAEFRNKR